ncbi:hypothetical protein K7X08_002245 [Anisodus acutangulus]|uniref:Uncharacterized protein n=1 Tax=Anisodus acutangulus TaxID=402998 RepID=A0A9Q1R3Z6_9SOLA|nr:hypothetical protein K7X08_002245 [Anisodus acutangulus]
MMSLKMLGSGLSVNGVRLRQSSLAAVIGDTTAVPDGAVNEQMSATKLSDSVSSQETDTENGEDREDASEGLDENKMLRRHNELLEVIRRSPSVVGDIVARRRKDFTKEFFVHLHTVAESYYDDSAEQNAVAKLGNTCLAAVQAYDTATESIEALNAKIDDLAQKNQLDSALVLMITKACLQLRYVIYHLYTTARGNLNQNSEISTHSEERMSALKDAFTPGEELEGKDVDCLYTTPEQLYN